MIKKTAIFCLLILTSIVLNVQANNTTLIRVGVHNNPPLCSINSNNRAEGIFIDIMELLAERNNWELEYHPYNFFDAVEALHFGKIDLLTAVAYSKERAQSFLFCKETVFSNWGVIYTTEGSQIESTPDLVNKRLGMEKGDIHSKAINQLPDDFDVKVNIVWCSSPDDIFKKLRDNEIDAGVVNKVYGFRQNIDHQLVSTSILFNPVNLKIAGSLHSKELLDKIDLDFRALKNNEPKRFEAIVSQWLISPLEQHFPKWTFNLIYVLMGLSFILLVVLFLLRSSVQTKDKQLNKEKQQRLSSEKTIKQLEFEKALILNSIDEHVVFMDHEYQIVWANDAFKKSDQRPFSKLLGRKCHQVYFNRSQPCTFCNYEKCLKTNKTETFEYYNANTERYLLVKTHPVHDTDQKAIGFVEILSDITDKKNNEKELIAAKERAEQADYLKSTFLANMSHEIRTPMNAIIGFSELLEDDGLTNDEKKSYVGIIQSNGQQLLKLISDILVFSQIESGHIEMQYSLFDVTDFLHSIYRRFKSDTQKNKKELSVEFEAESIPQKLIIESDSVRLKQIIFNLLTNAIKFTEEGSVTLGAHVQNDRLIIFVKDTGIGIPKKKHRDVFRRFSQVENNKIRKAVGSGLGLTIAHDLIKRLGGEIMLESEPDIGSTFYLIHPLKKTDL